MLVAGRGSDTRSRKRTTRWSRSIGRVSYEEIRGGRGRSTACVGKVLDKLGGKVLDTQSFCYLGEVGAGEAEEGFE